MDQFAGNTDYALRWPLELFAEEAKSLYEFGAEFGADEVWIKDVALLLMQGFTSHIPVRDFRLEAEREGFGPKFSGGIPLCVHWLGELATAARNGTVRPRPYFSRRDHGHQSLLVSDLPEIVGRVRSLVGKLNSENYFAEILGNSCYDDDIASGSTPERELDRLVYKPHLWTAAPEDWSEEDLYDFIEAFHDIATRPTKVWHHDHPCGNWHATAFCRETGQALYRALMNRLLDNTTLDLRVTCTGKDIGRMALTFPEGLGDFIEEMLDGNSPAHDQVSHAIATFRGRNRTVEQRRSATVALAGILEERRELLKENLTRKDESALFQIANEFHLRHQNEQQKKDYDPEFLDWIFYWYLATVKLSDQLLAKEAGS